MIRFECDYAEGMHPRILERLVETNMEQTAGYGEDSHCERAAALIKQACGREDIDVHFLVGGTQTNLTVIGSILKQVRLKRQGIRLLFCPPRRTAD